MEAQQLDSAPQSDDALYMPPAFTVYALDLSDPANDTETECADLDEALTHLRELITSELEDVSEERFERCGVRVDADQ